MFVRLLTVAIAALATGCASGMNATTAAGLPRSHSHHSARLVATGLQTPTAFAFGAGKLFVADGGSHDGNTPGGVFVVENGHARRLGISPNTVFGLAWRSGTLYVSAHNGTFAWSGWNGSTFTHTRTFYTGPRGFTGLSGLGFGHDGRLYAGVYLGDTNDHTQTGTPYAFDVLSFNTDGHDLRVVARGLRQPFQMAFLPGTSTPFFSDLGQDQPPGINPPDYIVRVHRGDNFGFPACNELVRSACTHFKKPFVRLPPHTSPMGLAIVGSRLYVALFGGIGRSGPEVASMPVKGGSLKPLLTGFSQPIVALSAHNGAIYVGETTGRVYSVRP